MRKFRAQTRLEASFIDISETCLAKARRHLGIKEKGLVKMAENSIYYGLQEDDYNLGERVEEFFRRLRQAYSSKNKYYMNSDYVFVFYGGTLIELIKIHPSIRGEVQECFRNNKEGFEALDADSKRAHIDGIEREFAVDSGFYFGTSNLRQGSEYLGDY